MKKSILTILILLLTSLGWAQITTTNPSTIIQQTGSTITITFDNSYMSTLNGNAGPLYVHTGVITTASTSSSDWKNVITPWPNSSNSSLANTTANKLTQIGTTTKWTLTIPDINTYYNLSTGTIVQQLAFVVRTATGTPQSSNLYIPVIQPGINLSIVAPTNNSQISIGVPTTITVNASFGLQTCNINLYVGNTSNSNITGTTPINSGTDIKTLSSLYTFNSTDKYYIIAQAFKNGLSLNDTVQVFVPEAVTNQARPAGTVAGINYIDNTSATLVLHAPNKSSVFLIGEFNDWSQLNSYQLKKDGEYWWITLTGLTPGKMYAYQYLVDGSLKISDPYTELVLDPWNDKWINQYYSIFPNLKAYPEGKTEGLVATLQTAKPAYSWEVSSFAMPSKENMVIYELLLRDFTKEKSLEAAISKLDYLKNLGITAVELMPIQEFDGNNSWGYNPNHYFAPDKAYGSPDMYKKFIDECHKRGIAVILDIVLNHASGINPFAMLFYDNVNYKPTSANPWMNVTATHPYSVLNDFNHSYSGTKDHFKRMVQYWINEYKVDGYRLDLTKGLTQTSSTEATASNYDQSRIDNITEYYNAAKSAKSDVMFILEHFCNYDEELALANKGMYLWRNSNNAYSQAAMGFQASSDFGGMISSPRQWVGYAESHDEERNFFKAKTYGSGTIATDSIARIQRVPLNVAFATLLPGPKMMWEFEELGFDYSINSNGGRTNPKPSAWGLLDLAHRKAAYDACSKVVTLRKMYPTAFTQGTFSTQVGASDWSQGRRIALTHNDLNMVVLGNFQASGSILASPSFPNTGLWYNLMTGASTYIASTSGNYITLQPGELLIYTDRKINFPSAVEQLSINENCRVYPSATQGMIYISTESNVKSVKVYNLQGAMVKTVMNKKELDLTNLTNGLYLLEVTTDNEKSIHKIVKE